MTELFNNDENDPQIVHDALALIVAGIGWETKSAKGFIAGYILGADPKEREAITAMDISDAYHEWFYNLSEGSMKFYREDAELTKQLGLGR